MNINKVEGNEIRINNPVLRHGQIINGKVAKLLPNNMAKIQLQQHQLVAKLEIPLTIGDRYHFQVQMSGNILYLKVIGEKLKNQIITDSSTLLKSLGIKNNDLNRSFVQQLLSEGVPFNKNQLIKSVQLLEQYKHLNDASSIFKEIIKRELPVSDAVFLALHTKNTENQSSLIKNLLSSLEKQNKNEELALLLKNFVKHTKEKESSGIENRLLKNITIEQLSRLLKQIGDYTTTLNRQESNINFNQEKLAIVLQRIINNEDSVHSMANRFLQTWGDKINHSLNNIQTLRSSDILLMKEQFSSLLKLFIPRNEVSRLTSTSSMNEMKELTQLLSSKGFYQVAHSETILKDSKENFLNHLFRFLTSSGMDYEYQITQQDKIPVSLKGYLLQMLFKDGTHLASAEKLLHFINGMQLNAIYESENFMYVNLNIPGGKLGLTNDINLDFNSKKTKKGKLDPDFCRIHFYLNLPRLKETIIDMNIQQRNVSLTIYNNIENLKSIVVPLQHILKDKLEKLNYKLTAVSYKPIKVESDVRSPLQNNKDYSMKTSRGVDLRI